MGDIAIPCDFIGSIYNDHPFIEIITENTCRFTAHGCFTHSRPPQEEDTLTRLYYIPDNIYRAVHGSTYTTGQPNDFPLTIADGRDTM
jgi:hypothetical protein